MSFPHRGGDKQTVKIGMQIPYRFLSEAPRPTDCETIAASPP